MYRDYNPIPMGEIAVEENIYQPSTINKYNNKAFMFWERALFQRSISSIKFYIPEEWGGSTKDFLLYCLFRNGFVAVFKELKYGTIFQPCSLNGFNIYYQPTEAIVTNPALDTRQLEIGKDCELLKLTPDYRGVWDIIRFYGEKLALLDASLNISLINSRLAYILGAKNKSAANALKLIMDKIGEGQSTIVYDKAIEGDSSGEPWVMLDRKNIAESYIGSELLENYRTLINNFDSEIGIPVLPVEKKERMIIDEARGRIVDGMSRATIWRDTFNSSAEKVNSMFGLDLRCELRYDGILENRKDGEESAGTSNNISTI